MLSSEQVRTHWWRAALVVAAVVVACFAASPFAGMFGLVPILAWLWLAPSPRTGVIVGAVLLALLAWFVLPGALSLAGPWVPAPIELYWLHPTLAAVACAIGARRGFVRLSLLVVAGFAVAGGAWFADLEAAPGDEGVVPVPAGLRAAQDVECGSGGCWRVLEATGDRAPEVLRDHLTARHFTPAPQSGITRVPRFCRRTGLLVTHEVCAELRTLSPDAVRVEWYVN
ncbi:hypothetical protein Amsp01_103590 [Amycolatopsis sp. NBRC 101858]|uniref:hypothetical protein n=1 Tax=Amycolatopsis sp. NBRC 101858 TaxID=3032200 RepID=UPI0024A291C0|nr:hypothetical protein [Amycolatopsis sp. NBRC 101858]GLY44336.1 hypothetical protein Amsp01_103590 [Amycolatopsis sp. NBRC 101858]